MAEKNPWIRSLIVAGLCFLSAAAAAVVVAAAEANANPSEAAQEAPSGSSEQLLTVGKPAPSGAADAVTYLSTPVEETASPGSGNAKGKTSLEPSDTNGQRERDEAESIMEEALELLDQSQIFWSKGDIENALDLLDRAYAIILDTDGDPNIARQKDDLRLLIAKKILAIYTSMQTVTTGKRGEIPIVMNADVEKEIRSFQGIEREFFVNAYQRSFIYRPIIVRELKKAGLPEELSWLPLVESGYKVLALSRARALGLWQFIPSTGYKYGLNRDDWVDERMDVEKSTRAAIGYLKDLHEMFGDWMTVLAAYNCGEGRVLRVISRQHLNYLDRFWDLYSQLPNETARYVPRFLATLHIIKDPKKYGMDLDENPPRQQTYAYETVATEKTMRLADIAQGLDLSEDTLAFLNSELRHRMTPDRVYQFKIPPGSGERLVQVMNDIPRWEKPRFASGKGRTVTIRHKVRPGETAESIARRYRISVKSLLARNRILAGKGLVAGQRLTIQVKTYAHTGSSERREKERTRGAEGGAIRHVVQKGDTLSSICRQYDVPQAQIRRMNDMEGDRILVGQTLTIASQPSAEGASGGHTKEGAASAGRRGKQTSAGSDRGDLRTYVIQKGDTLSEIARSNNMKLGKLLELNGMATTDAIHPGQVINVK
ncbi:MAG TPA: LysM peptidoglycan-binding domain-containing protein [Syntrophales bacterium]|nr:LysM peptidoglycan-binding domain-containing protein [Syntrophales bacterium]